jgi:hypothetical protein
LTSSDPAQPERRLPASGAADRCTPAATGGSAPQLDHERPVARPPAPVAAVAAGHQLGALRAVQAAPSPAGTLALGLALVLALFGVMAGLNGLDRHWHFFLWRALDVLVCPFFVISVGYTLIAPIVGLTGTWRYEGGLVHRRNRRISALPWSQVAEVQLWKAGGDGMMRGRLLSWLVIGVDGSAMDIEARQDTTFGDQICAIVAGQGRPVNDSGPYVGRLRK